jgi:UDP-3-O-[3-hydroxymyristoyl] glucosamine N-acyltransferase
MTAFARLLPKPTTARALCAAIAPVDMIGDPDRVVRRVGSLAATADDVLAFCDAADAAEHLRVTRTSVVFVRRSAHPPRDPGKTVIVVDDVRAAFIDVILQLLPSSERPGDPAPGVDATARVDVSASIAPSACIGAGVVVGARTRIATGAVIYADCELGADCTIGPNAVIGWVGLSYHDRNDGRRSFFPHLGGVRMGNRVDVGAHACICRGMLSDTTIGDDAKLGSLVYVSHGVDIGARCWLSAGAAVAGHATLGDNALLGIGSIVVDNVSLEPGVRTSGGSVVTRSAAAGTNLQGVPAQPVAAMRRFGPTPRE